MEKKRMRLRMLAMTALAAVAWTGAPDLAARVSHPTMDVGTRCQQEYQNNWQVDVANSDVWRRLQ